MEDSLVSRKNKGRPSRRLPTDRKKRRAATTKSRQVWQKKGSDGRTAESGQPRILPQRSKNGDAKPVSSPHVWLNKFVSSKSFSSYCFTCNGDGHREDEWKMRPRNRQGVLPRNNKLVCKRCNAYGNKISEYRNMHMITFGYANKNPFATHRNANYVCYNCTGFDHRSYECRKKISYSYGNQWNNNTQCESCHRGYERQISA